MSRDVFSSDFSFIEKSNVALPGMITQEEKGYLTWLASQHSSGKGAVVEVGTWLGSSTAHIALGLGGRPIKCFDHFVWSETYNPKSEHKLGKGDDFSHLFLANMREVGANVTAIKSKMRDLAWGGEPIELLVLDAPKIIRDLKDVFRAFMPSMIEGGSYVAIQDYQYFPAYQIAFVMDYLRDYISLAHVVLGVGNSSPNSVGFHVDRRPPREVIDAIELRPEDWPQDRVETTWSRIMAPLPPQARMRLGPGLGLFLYDTGHVDAAKDRLTPFLDDPLQVRRWSRLSTAAVAKRYPELFTLMTAHETPATA